MSILAGNSIRSRVTSIVYDATNPLVGSPGAGANTQYQPRDTSPRLFNLGIAEDGVVDLGIELRSTLNAEVTATLMVVHTVPSTSSGQTIWQGDIPADGRVVWLPERSTHENGFPLQRIYAIAELRMPLHRIRLTLTPKTAPTTGELYLRLVRRY